MSIIYMCQEITQEDKLSHSSALPCDRLFVPAAQTKQNEDQLP